ncbi:MAG: MBL fold metallo-hydrolase [Desulfosalsimonadaceae bacterium]|nr:MBL fold metallo-hydrolase [Desulfosalsimonadaceae bacterium]
MDSGPRVSAFLHRPDVVELAPDLYLISGKNKARFPYCNAFLITGDETVLIDTGVGVVRLKELDESLRIDKIIISHPHPDHISGCKVLKDRPLLLPAETPDSVNDLVNLGIRFTGTPENGAMWAEFAKNSLGIEPLREPAGRFGDGDMLDFGAVRLEAIRAPGHLPDHYCFFDHCSKTLLTTDIDFTSFGPWYGNPECEIAPFKESIRKIMDLPYLRVCSSHKPPVEGDATDEFTTYLEMFKLQRRRILHLCDPSATLEQMVRVSPFYGNKLNDKRIQEIFEENMILKNLELLMQDGRVAEKDGVYRIIR